MAKGELEILITNSAAYLLGGWSDVSPSGTTVCGATGEDLATLSTNYLNLEIMVNGLKLCK